MLRVLVKFRNNGVETPGAGWGIVDLGDSYTLSGARSVSRGVALIRGGTERQDGVLILDEFDAGEATNVTWRMHTRANISLTSVTTATLTSTVTGDGSGGLARVVRRPLRPFWRPL
eukprot:SAG25_NODE_8099_length_440_cov_0.900293_1_plen_116_part_00